MSTRFWLASGALAGAIGVAVGAFGAHGLRRVVPPDLLVTFETGVRYHLVHALALVAVGCALDRRPGRWASVAGWCFLVGILLFSGSLYALVLSGARWLGVITPLGGVAFIGGWLAVAIHAATFRER
jgi:uncharacterized membrane protein YgdD (TMEM256/DUF423 family)